MERGRTSYHINEAYDKRLLDKTLYYETSGTFPRMTTKEKKKSVSFDDEELTATLSKAASLEGKRIRKVHPLGLRVVARIIKDSNLTDGGLYLPEGAKESLQESVLAEVVEVASAVDSHSEEETNVSGVPLGARVLIGRTAGIRIPWDDDLRIVDTRDVLAIVDEIFLT
jgi:co-chaperonin GroES (HSP10)